MRAPNEISLPDRIRLPFRFEPAPLQREVRMLERSGWTDHFVKHNYEGQWGAIPLRAPEGETHPIRMIFSDPGAKDYADQPALADTPYLREILRTFSCPLLSVRLMRLGPGSVIKPHCDPDLDAASGTARLHIPIATGPRVEFLLAGRAVAMAPGECWYLRLSEIHSVHNRGSEDRVHLVIDAVVNEWLAATLSAAAAQA
ncbi:MAG: aspartyl/asparaginyl beta-hydroxylase domain-containing protein [Rhizomicrobium sp.]